MVTESERRATGTWRALGVFAVLAAVLAGPRRSPPACGRRSPGASTSSQRPPAASTTAQERRASTSIATCSVEGHLYVVYVLEDQAAAEQAAAAARTLHPTGTVEVDGTDVWVTE